MGIMEVTVKRSLSADTPVYPDDIKRIQDVYDTWIIENLGYRIIPDQHFNGRSPAACAIEFTYEFRCKEDAMAFKLRWID